MSKISYFRQFHHSRRAALPRLAWVMSFFALLHAPNALSEWTYEETADRIEGGLIAIASTEAPDATMMVRCWTATSALDVRLSVRPELGPLFNDAVAVIFDDRPEQRTNWTLLPGGFGYEVPEAQRAAFLIEMKVGSLMSVHVANHPESDGLTDLVRLRIPLIGSQAAIDDVLTKCE